MHTMPGDLNILYIHTHDTGRYIQPYGYAVPTPNLQNFARNGTIFRQAFSCAPTCSPSRAGLLTGMMPHSCGMVGLAHLGFGLDNYSHHLVQFLNNNGYETILCGIQHEAADVELIGYKNVVGATGERLGSGGFSTAEYDLANAAEAARCLRSSTKGPFFLSFGTFSTHREFPENEDGLVSDYSRPPSILPDNPRTRQDFAAYLRSAAVADRCFGILMEALNSSTAKDSTLVIFTTDHGIAFPNMKGTLFDSGIGVSLLVDFPGNQRRGGNVDALVSQIDLFPTICELAHLELPLHLQGCSLLPLLNRDGETIRDQLFAENNYHVVYDPMRCVRNQRHKLIRYFGKYDRAFPANCDDSPSKDLFLENGFFERPREREMLFDLYFDPGETTNLASEKSYQQLYQDLNSRLLSWMEQTNDPLLRGEVPKPEGAVVGDSNMISPKELQ
jgi:arylsulfatase A-like enzyme